MKCVALFIFVFSSNSRWLNLLILTFCVSEQVEVPVYTMGTEVKPAEIARQGLAEAKKKNVDVVIMDTAGRLQVLCIFICKSDDSSF